MPLQEIASMSMTGMQAILSELDAELERTYLHAKMICDMHWENMLEEADDRTPRFITRVRPYKGSLQCIWMRAGSRPPSKKGGQIKATHVPKGTGRNNPNYKSSAFNKAEPWERELIDETEANYALLRERYMKLSNVRNEIHKTNALAHKAFGRVGILWK